MLFCAFLILAPAGIYCLYRMIFYGNLPMTCPYCGSRDTEYLSGDSWRCRKCADQERRYVERERAALNDIVRRTPLFCTSCGSRDTEYLGGDTWKCRKCGFRFR